MTTTVQEIKQKELLFSSKYFSSVIGAATNFPFQSFQNEICVIIHLG